MRKKLFHNWGLKLASLILAFVLWFLVIQIENPIETKTFSNVPVKLTNTELLERANKVYEVLDNTDVVRVTVHAPRSIIEKLRSSDIVAEADMSKLTDVNTIAISYYVSSPDIDTMDVSSIKGNHDDVVRLNVEDKSSRYIDLVSQTEGDVEAGYMLGSVTLDQNRIEVSGPKSAVETVGYAGASIDVTGATNSLSANVEIQLYDREGNVLNQENIKKQTDYAHIAVEVLAVKEIPVEITYGGTPADGYMETGRTLVNPSSVRIAGTVSALSSIAKISIPEEELSIMGADKDVSEAVDIRKYLPENVRLADNSFNGYVAVTIYIEPIIEKNVQVPVENLTITNVPEGYIAEFYDEYEAYTVRAGGLGERITPLRGNTITGTIDVGGWLEEQEISVPDQRSYYMDVVFEPGEGITIISPVAIRIALREDEE